MIYVGRSLKREVFVRLGRVGIRNELFAMDTLDKKVDAALMKLARLPLRYQFVGKILCYYVFHFLL